MKLKYKKIVLVITFGTMLIGLVVFSMIPGKGKRTKETLNQTAKPSASSMKDVGKVASGQLQKNAHPEINELIQRYFEAKMTVDMDTMESLVSDVRQVDERKLRKQLEYIEAMENIDCYTFENPSDGGYRVYVYYELKLRGIDALAPALTGLYVTQTSEEDSYVIYLSTLDAEAQSFIELADQSQASLDLAEGVRVKLNEALAKDAKLKEFYDMLEQASEAEEKEPATKEPEKAQGQ